MCRKWVVLGSRHLMWVVYGLTLIDEITMIWEGGITEKKLNIRRGIDLDASS
jgi:hypothetical protein